MGKTSQMLGFAFCTSLTIQYIFRRDNFKYLQKLAASDAIVINSCCRRAHNPMLN